MSADTTDVARIQDEDLLRKMWQETDDFGRKKEIRSHMYKLREARLKDFYNSADVNTDFRQTSKTTDSKTMTTSHAASLADQSYGTLKSKEVRDSGSPTRDNFDKSLVKHQDQGWTVSSSNERSVDGKTHTTTHSASTAGTQQIDGGKLDYVAKLQEKASVHQDGDDNNFTRAVNTSSNSVVRQDACGGDQNSNFRSSTTKSSSSSHYQSESRNATENIQALPSSTTSSRDVPYASINEENARSVVQKSYTTNVPNDLKSHPSYIEGKTKVTQETKTLADGTVVTTTKYETKQGNSTQTATHKKYSNIAASHSEQRSSSSTSQQQSNRRVSSDTRNISRNDQRAVDYIIEPRSTAEINVRDVENIHRSNINRSQDSSYQQSSKTINESRRQEQTSRDIKDEFRQNHRRNENVEYVEIPFELPVNQTTSTKTKHTVSEEPQYKSPTERTVTTKTSTTSTTKSGPVPREETNSTYVTTSTHLVNNKQDIQDTKQATSDQFISTERRHEVDTRQSATNQTDYASKPQPKEFPAQERSPKTPQESYIQPERRQPIKPGKSELNQKSTATEGQYDTTYRSEFTNKKISVEVSATHDAFARSLRSVTPERITRGSPRSSSNASLRSTSSPEKMRTSPDRLSRAKSPRKTMERFDSNETFTYTNNRSSPPRKNPERQINNQKVTNGETYRTARTETNYDTITRRTKSTKDEIDSSTLTRRKPKPRSPSPTTTTTSDFEYRRSSKDVTTDLDEDITITRKESRPSSLEISTKKTRKVTERSPTSPLTDIVGRSRSTSPKKETSPNKESPNSERPKLIRTNTYEERVKEILGLTKDTTDLRRSSLEKTSVRRNSKETTIRSTSSEDVFKRLTKSDKRESPRKSFDQQKSPDNENRKSSTIEQISSRRSPSKEKPSSHYPERKSPTKSATNPAAENRKSPEKSFEPYPQKEKHSKTAPNISEFPSQIRKSPNKEASQPHPHRKSPTKTGPTIKEFPSQIRKSPEKDSLEPYLEQEFPSKSPSTSSHKISEFPSQIRKSPDKVPLEPYQPKRIPTESAPTISEFPSQIRKSPERSRIGPYPEKEPTVKTGPNISEFPSQTRKSPEKYFTKPTSLSDIPTFDDESPASRLENMQSINKIEEFPSQIRRSPEKMPLEPYPEKSSPKKESPTIQEFPSQIKKTPEKQILEPYPAKTAPRKESPQVTEFPSQNKKESGERPKSPLKKQSMKSPRTKTESESSTSEEEIVENISERFIDTYESKVPIKEPEMERKIFTELCKADESRIDKKISTQKLIENEITENQISQTQINKGTKKQTPISNGVPLKSTSKKQVTSTTEVTTKVSQLKKDSPKDKVPVKKPLEKTSSKPSVITSSTTTTTKTVKKETPRYISKIATPKKPQTVYKVEKTQFVGATEYQDEFSKVNKISKVPVTKPSKTSSKTTLYDIEKSSKIQEDRSVHTRTNRVDDTVTKKKVTKTIHVNGDSKAKPSPARLPSPTKKSPVSPTSTSKPTDVKPKASTVSQTRYTTTLKKTVNEISLKGNKPSEPKKQVVATISVTPKSAPKTKPSAKPTGLKIKTKTSPTSQTPRKVANGYVSSDTDDELVIESVDGSFIDLTEKQQYSETSRTQAKTDFRTYRDDEENRRRVVTTKTVQITNEDGPDREITVVLQRSKSSREPTPDRLCPRPLTSDEEEDSTPVRYPDQISEPDDGTLKRKYKKLADIPIHETEETSDFTRITEMTDTKSKISKVDKVEETDESLLSIDKKIHKFLNTADQLTKEPVRPKVVRPNFEVSEDLKEDECLLSVSDKVTKFISTAEQLTTTKLPERPKSPRPKETTITGILKKKVSEFETSVEESLEPVGPTTKVPRPDLGKVDDTLKEDDCLLSVSDKVSKFINTAEQLTSSTNTNKSVNLSKIHIEPKEEQPGPKPERKSPIRETFIPDRRSPTRDSPLDKRTTSTRLNENTNSKNLTSDFIQTEKREEIITRKSPSLSPERRRSPSPGDVTPKRKPSNQMSSILKTSKTTTETENTEMVMPDTTPKSTRRPSQEEHKTGISSVSRLRSSESVKRAKALFENVDKDQDKRQRDILSRPSVFDGRKIKKTDTKTTKIDVEETQETTRRSSFQKSTDKQVATTVTSRRTPSPGKSPERPSSPQKPKHSEKIEITRYRATSPEKILDDGDSPREDISRKLRSREPTPEGDMPHYMKPLDRSLRPNSPHRSSITETKTHESQIHDEDETRQTKFGVTLRRTDSGRTSKTSETTTERRKSSITLEKRITEEEVEEIFDLLVLEELLEKIVGYEIRRKIRTQIRLVKKLISEGTLEVYLSKRRSAPREAISRRGSSPTKSSSSTTEYQSTYVRKVSPSRKPVNNKLYEHTDVVDRRDSIEQSTTEYQSSYSQRRSSTESSQIARKSVSPARKPSPQRSSPERVSKTVEDTPMGKVTTVQKTEVIPGGLRTTTTKTTEKTFTTLKKTVPPVKKTVEDTQPEWVRQRNLKNSKDRAVQTNKKVSSTSTTTSSTRKSTQRTSPAKQVKSTDIVTSSYGVGPTDDNGTPLFGLRALRTQNKNENMKVQGTVIRSEYYSENDQEPVGQISVTKYSNDPRDLEQDGFVSTNGDVTSVTTTQKFGYDDTPSLKSLSENRKEICDSNETTSTTTKTTKVNRRGSVKELSKKFIDNAVETLKSERQTSYPKAGLILRSSSLKSSSGGEGEPDSRESSPVDDRQSQSTYTVRTMKTSSGDTFLTNKSKISGVQDVLTRMKNEDCEEGDSEEDIAARGLLNKFLGAQVILTGMEQHQEATSSSSKTTSTIPSGSSVRRTTKITSTITEGGRPTTTTRVFQRPVSEKELETVWDEQSLRVLLEQSTDYEERRVIRIRLRQVMAEQEEAVETTKEVKQEGDVTTTKVTTKVTQQQQVKVAPKPISPFAKFRQLDKQNSVNKPTPPRTSN